MTRPSSTEDGAPSALDHRALQRTLFRMQMDAGFAEGILAGREDCLATSDLGPAELALLREVDPAGVGADPEAKRRRQVLGNVASEFTGTLALASSSERDPLGDFPGSRHFHEAVRRNTPLPLALAQHLAEHALEEPARSVLELERAMVEVRRLDPVAPSRPGPAQLESGQIGLSPSVRLIDLPAGTLDLADELSRCLAAGREISLPPLDRARRETVLLQARPPGDPERWLSLGARGLSEIHAERLEGATVELLRALSEPADRTRLEALAAELGATLEELRAFVDGLIADRVLVRGEGG